MDAVEILLSCVVGFSVSVFLIIGFLEERTRKTAASDEQANIVGRENPDSGSTYSDLGTEKEEEPISDWDWEGIERIELEKVFGGAVVFVSSKCINGGGGDDRIHQDLKPELYGLSKIALDGPCYESQPMPFKLSARSNWNAWQKLGDMSRETAMQKYIDILSKEIPGWEGKPVTIEDDAAAAATSCENTYYFL